MPVFQYAYLNEVQKKKKGFIEADSYSIAKEKLLKRNICILSIVEKKKGYVREKKISLVRLISFTKQLRLLLRSGLPVYESLCNLEERYWGDTLGAVIHHLSDRIREGTPLSGAMLDYPQIFNEFYRSAILSGEAIGNLESALLRLEESLTSESTFKKQIFSSLSYPLVLALFSLGVVCFFLVFVVPSLKEVIEDKGLNWVTSFVFGISNFLCAFKWQLLVIMGSIFCGLFIFRKYLKVNKHFMSFLMSLGWIRGFVIKLSLSRFFRVLHVLLQGDSNLVAAVAIASRTLYPNSLNEAFKKAMNQVISGSRLSLELSQYSFIPKTVIQMIALGEDTGELSISAGYLADIYEEEIRKFLQLFVAWSQPVILMFLGGVIALIMLAVLIPLTSGFSF